MHDFSSISACFLTIGDVICQYGHFKDPHIVKIDYVDIHNIIHRALHYIHSHYIYMKIAKSTHLLFPIYPCSCAMFGRLFCHRSCSQTVFRHHCKNLSSLPNTLRRRPTIRQLYPAIYHTCDIANRIQHISSTAVSLDEMFILLLLWHNLTTYQWMWYKINSTWNAEITWKHCQNSKSGFLKKKKKKKRPKHPSTYSSSPVHALIIVHALKSVHTCAVSG